MADGSLLNYEAATSHLITIRSTDNGGLYFDKSFTITVNNVNETPTNVSLSASSVNENAALNTVVGNLSTSDPDAGNTFTYSLVAPNSNAGGRFKIVGAQVQVANSSLLNYEAATSHLITVRTTDQGGLYFDKTFTITLNNVNETPTDISLSATSVNENAANDSFVANVTTTDPDAGSTFTYTFVSPYYNAGDRFKIVNGQLLVANGAGLNYESQSYYGITIRVTDQGGLTYTESWTIYINNVNETPTNIALSASSIAENAANNTAVGNLTSTDPDSAQTFTYSLVAPNGDAGGRFKISGAQIQVANGTLLNYEAATSHLVTVRTTDQGGLYYDKAFTITVTNVNETPTDVALSASAVNENAANNSVVGSLSSTDPDAGNTFTYTFVSPNSSAGGRFKIVGSQIQVNDGTLLNYEAATSHLVTVRATDQGGLYFEKSFTITINNVNETPTDIALSASTVAENAANDTVVGNLSGTDPDAGATFTYSFVAPNNDGGGRFKIVGSQIQVANGTLLNYEAGTSHLVTVRVVDNTGLTYDESFTIAVNNVNEAPTNLTLSGCIVNENASMGTIVGALSATDPDSGNTFSYSLVAPYGDAGGRFRVMGSDIQVYYGTLDYEANTSHQITVRATDQGGLYYDKSFTIALRNANDPPTNIALSNAAVNENSATGTVVGNLSTSDQDTTNTFTYAFVSPNYDANGAFSIVGSQLRVGVMPSWLNHEVNPTLSITVRTYDNNGQYFDKTFTIEIRDVAEFQTSLLNGTTPIANGSGPVSFGSVAMGGTAPSLTFTLRNNGDTALATSNLSVPNRFSIFDGLAASIPAGGSDTFTIILLTGTAGTFSGTVSFQTNDPAASLFQFYVTGTVTLPSGGTYVNFGYLGTELGTNTQPFNTLAEGIAAVNSGETLYISTGSSAETPRITKNVRLFAVGGPVRIGVGGVQMPAPSSAVQPADGLGAQRRNAAQSWALYR